MTRFGGLMLTLVMVFNGTLRMIMRSVCFDHAVVMLDRGRMPMRRSA